MTKLLFLLSLKNKKLQAAQINTFLLYRIMYFTVLNQELLFMAVFISNATAPVTAMAIDRLSHSWEHGISGTP